MMTERKELSFMTLENDFGWRRAYKENAPFHDRGISSLLYIEQQRLLPFGRMFVTKS